jgi:hypothetical protein
MSNIKYGPPKDIASQIWGACFDYKPLDTVIDGYTVDERVRLCWTRIHRVLHQNTDWFVDFVNSYPPDEP